MTVQGGTTANNNGKALEKYILSLINEKHYTYIKPTRFTPSRCLEQPIYTKQFHLCQSIYDTPLNCDFILYHPKKWANNLVIECKWQQANGSVDEKFPYMVLNIREKYLTPTIIVIGGGGWKKGAENWLRSYVGQGNLVDVFNMEQFATWVNKNNI